MLAKADKKKRKSRLVSTEMRQLMKRLPALMLIEGFGTFLLVAVPTAVATAASLDASVAGTPADSLAVAIAFGATLAVIVWLFADVTGAHFNPAVSIALALTDRGTDKVLTVCYVLAQLVGATLGSLLVALLFIANPGARASGYGVTQPGDGFGLAQVLIVEFIGTMLLIVMVSRVTDPRRKKVPSSAIGVTLGLLVLGFGPFSGGAFNPARALGPMIVSGQWNVWWAYVAAEIAGAAAGAFIYTRGIVAVPPAEDSAT